MNERQKAQETAETFDKNMEYQCTGIDKFIQSWGNVEIKRINTWHGEDQGNVFGKWPRSLISLLGPLCDEKKVCIADIWLERVLQPWNEIEYQNACLWRLELKIVCLIIIIKSEPCMSVWWGRAFFPQTQHSTCNSLWYKYRYLAENPPGISVVTRFSVCQ